MGVLVEGKRVLDCNMPEARGDEYGGLVGCRWA